MPHEIHDHQAVLEAIRRTDIIAELVDQTDGQFVYELDLEVIAYGRNYSGKKVGPYAHLLVYQSGEEVITQGDWGGNSFYVGVEGELNVFINVAGGERKLVDTQKPGKSFGEMSVLAGLPRTATLAVPDGATAKVLLIERPALRLLRKLPKFGQMLDQVYRNNGLRRTVDDVLDLSARPDGKALAARLAAIAEFKIYRKQQVLVRSGDPIENIYFVRHGWLKQDLSPGKGGELSAEYFGPGNCMGLIALTGKTNWDHGITMLAHAEIMEAPLSALRGDADLVAALTGIFQTDPSTSTINSNSTATAEATEREITTGLIDGSNLLIMDMDLCVRCGNCSMACHQVHGQSRLVRRGISFSRPVVPASTRMQHILAPSVCLHCADPECLTGCPTGAIGRFPGGQIDIEKRTCIGCGDCATQCPYNAISMIPRQGSAAATTGGMTSLVNFLNLSPPALPPAVTEITDLLAVKCNLCENTGMNPPGAATQAYSCEHNCPTGALLRVNPREYFAEAGAAVGLVYQDKTHAIGRNIHRHDPVARLWHVGGVAASILLTALGLWAAFRYGLDGRLGGTWLTVRWITGLVGLVGIASVMTYPGRKQVYRRRAGPLRYWLLAHIYAGVIAGLLLMLHGGRGVGGLLTTSLMVSFDLVIASGLFGLVCYVIVPRILTAIEGEPLLVEDLEKRRGELRAQLVQLRSDNQIGSLVDREVVPRLLTLANLAQQYLRREPLTDTLASARAQFRIVLDGLTERRDRERLVAAIETCATLRRVDALIYLHRLLKVWLPPHVVSTSLMLILMLVHIIQVVYFAVR
ncbi:MAG: cyclic nucleotide-binding domain-containing protein [Pyrinomonadaceae bacterium]